MTVKHKVRTAKRRQGSVRRRQGSAVEQVARPTATSDCTRTETTCLPTTVTTSIAEARLAQLCLRKPCVLVEYNCQGIVCLASLPLPLQWTSILLWTRRPEGWAGVPTDQIYGKIEEVSSHLHDSLRLVLLPVCLVIYASNTGVNWVMN